MRLRKAAVGGAGRTSAARRLGVAVAAACLLALSMTGAVVAASPANATSYFTLFNVHTAYCLTSGGNTDTDALEYSCDGSENQNWYWGSRHGTTAYYQLKNEGTGQCLSVKDDSTASGAYIDVWSCTTNDSMYWMPENDISIGSADYMYIWNFNSGDLMQTKCDCAQENGAIIQATWDDLGSPNQMWSYG
jgi:hypothetical protein